MVFRYYKTPFENFGEDRFQVLKELLEVDAETVELMILRPRVLCFSDCIENGKRYLSAIVVWESVCQ